jgi:hypothetical protein
VLLVAGVDLDQALDWLMAATASVFVFKLFVTVLAEVAVAARCEDDRARLTLAGSAAVALYVDSVHTLPLERWRVWDLLGRVLLSEALPQKPADRSAHALEEALDAPHSSGGQETKEGTSEEAAEA